MAQVVKVKQHALKLELIPGVGMLRQNQLHSGGVTVSHHSHLAGVSSRHHCDHMNVSARDHSEDYRHHTGVNTVLTGVMIACQQRFRRGALFMW